MSAPTPATETPVRFSEAQVAEVRRLQALYPDRQAALLPVLRLAQEAFGYVSLEVEVAVAELFGISPAHVHEVVTFYTLFFLRGAEDVVTYLEERLGISAGETTADGRVTLHRVECLCACEAAPMMQVDEEYVGPLDRAAVDRALEGLR